MNLPPCPHCSSPIQPDWDYCHHCGYDPDNARATRDEPAGPRGFGATGGYAGAKAYPPSAYESGPKRYGGLSMSAWATIVGLSVIVLFAGVFLLTRKSGNEPQAGVKDLAPTSSLPSGWTRFQAREGGLTIDLPARPDLVVNYQKIDGGTLEVHEYTAHDGDFTYGVYFAEIPAGTRMRAEDLPALVAARKGGNVTDVTTTNYEGKDAVEFTLTSDTDVYRVRAVIGGKRLYVMTLGEKLDTSTTGDPNGTTPPPPSASEFAKYVGSLKMSTT